MIFPSAQAFNKVGSAGGGSEPSAIESVRLPLYAVGRRVLGGLNNPVNGPVAATNPNSELSLQAIPKGEVARFEGCLDSEGLPSPPGLNNSESGGKVDAGRCRPNRATTTRTDALETAGNAWVRGSIPRLSDKPSFTPAPSSPQSRRRGV